MIAISFARESNKFDKTAYSIKTQVDAIEQQAKADKTKITHTFIERFSGRDLRKMPKLNELRKLLKTHESEKKIVYVYAQDRLVRGEEAIDIFYLLVEFRHMNATLQIVKDPLDLNSIGGQILALIRGHEASGEIDKILDRTWTRGKLRRIKEGLIPNFGREKYGYRRDKATGTATTHPEEAAIVKLMAELFCAGHSWRGVARELNARGFRNRAGKLWRDDTIRHMMRDPAYAGQGAALRFVGGTGKRRPPDQWIPLAPGAYPALITPQQWAYIEAERSKSIGTIARNQKYPALLRGMITCSLCNRPCYIYVAGEKKYTYYRCASWFTKKNSPDAKASHCNNRTYRQDQIEGEVWERLIVTFASPKETKALFARATPAIQGQQDDDLALIATALAEKDKQQSNLLRIMRDASPALTAKLQEEFEVIQAERNGLLAQKQSILNRTHVDQLLTDQIAAIQQQAETFYKQMRKATPAQRAELLRILQTAGLRVVVSKDGWRFSLVVTEKSS